MKRQNIQVQLTTNASLLHLIKPSILGKIDNINISLDKIDPTCFRYKYNTTSILYERIKKNIAYCSKKFNNISLNTVFDENIGENDVLKLLDFVKENGIRSIKFIPLIDYEEERCIQNLKDILFKNLNLNSVSTSNEFLITEYCQDNYKIYILKQYCNNDCEECKKNSFVRINWDGKIYPCRKDMNKFIDVENLIKEKNGHKIMWRIEECFSEK